MKTTKKWRAFGGTQHWCEHTSDACGGDMALSVFVPPGDGPFPVVTFLSGLTCTAENFTTKAGAQRVAAELGLIVVAPDTSPRGAGYAGEDDDWDFGTGADLRPDLLDPYEIGYRKRGDDVVLKVDINGDGLPNDPGITLEGLGRIGEGDLLF